MQYFFNAWPDFLNDYRAAPHRLFLFDYDGTLSTIVGRPEDARLTGSVKDKLKGLLQKPKTSVGVISGRSLQELKAMAGIAGLYYSGNHGLEVEGPNLKYIHPEAEAFRGLMKELAVQFTAALRDIEGVIVQDKGLSLSVHYRLIRPENEGAIARAVKRITAHHVKKDEIKVYPMKKIWEIRPQVEWDKGKAVLFIGSKIKAHLKLTRLLTVYTGDDATDEDAFKIMRRPEGWGIYVGGESQTSAAGYFLRATNEVEQLLGRLIELK